MSMIDDEYQTEEYASAAMQPKTSQTKTYSDMIALIIRKAKNSREYKKYVEIASMLVLNYYKRYGDLNKAHETVYKIIESVDTVNTLVTHYKALMHEEKNNGEGVNQQARNKIASTLLNDYKKRFGDKKAEAYNVLVLQSWVAKVESVNELAILMDSILTVRDKLGNSWDYEGHIVPILLDKAFSTDVLVDFSNSTANLVVGLSKRLKDNYLAVMTAVKILEYADSPKKIKMYLRDMIKDASKRIDQINAEIAIINSQPMSRITKLPYLRQLNREVKDITKQIEDMMNGIDPRELMLENTKR